jgi:hypothetical protein
MDDLARSAMNASSEIVIRQANRNIGDVVGGSRAPLRALDHAELFEAQSERSALASGGLAGAKRFRQYTAGGIQPGKLSRSQVQMIRWVMKALRTR